MFTNARPESLMLSRSHLHSIKKIIKRIYHRLCFLCGISYLASLFTKDKLKILLYHRVSEHERSTFRNSLRVTPNSFERQICYLLRKTYNIISLQEAVHLLNHCIAIPENSIVITFDDGYRDFYHNAFPILRKYGVPATVFLTTRCIDSEERLWLDRIDYAILNTKKQKVCVNEREFNLTTIREKHCLYLYLHKFLETMGKEEMDSYLYTIFEELDIQSIDTDRVSLNWDEIREMAKCNISFGAHGVSHISLAHQLPEVVEEEIAVSKHRMDAELSQNTAFFAYPYGQQENFNERVAQHLKEFGFLCALARQEDFNDKDADLFSLRRASIEGDHSMVDFYNKLAGAGIHRLVRRFSKR